MRKPVLVELPDGRVVTAQQHYLMLCEQFGLTVGKGIERDPKDPERWIESGSDRGETHVEELTDTVG